MLRKIKEDGFSLIAVNLIGGFKSNSAAKNSLMCLWLHMESQGLRESSDHLVQNLPSIVLDENCYFLLLIEN